MEEDSLKYAADFAQLADELLAEHRELPTLDRIVTLAVEAVDGCDYCAITLRESNGRLSSPAATGPIAAQAAELEDQLREGPCVDVAVDMGTISVSDFETETRWPNWTPAAAALGIRSMLSIRLDVTGQPIAASLNLFAGQPAAFDSTDLAIASIFARHAATALAAVRTQEGLRAAARSRQIIGVAQGMLMQRFGLTLDQSFELLRRYSQTHNIKLRVLAETLAESGGVLTSADPADPLEQAFGLDPQEKAANSETGWSASVGE
jgi:GAF domain-containing protein